MKKSYMRRWAICICAFVLTVSTVTAQKKKVLPEAATPYFTLPTEAPSTPTEDGFLQRWMLLEPISAPVRTNTVFTDSYLREKFYNDYRGPKVVNDSHSFTAPRDYFFPINAEEILISGIKQNMGW